MYQSENIGIRVLCADHIDLLMFVFFPGGLAWCISGLSRPPIWTPSPSTTCGTVQLSSFTCFLWLHEVSSYRVPAELSLAHHQLSSAQQRTAAQAQQRSAVQCRALPCCVVLCRAVPCCVLYCICSFVQCQESFEVFCSAAQRSAMRCCAVPCPAVRCGAVRCCAVLCLTACFAVLTRSYDTRYRSKYTSYRYHHIVE